MKENVAISYKELAAINVNEHTEKRGNLTYLSWAWAVDQLLRLDENAMWSYGVPQMFGETMMITCTVEAFGRARTAQLPVMDNRFKAIANPNAFEVNVAMQRCLAKAIALHGLGLYIYAGEDLPTKEEEPAKTEGESEAKKPVPVQKTDSALQEKSEKPSEAPSSSTHTTIITTPIGAITVPEEIEKQGEAAVVDFITEFVQVFVPGVNDIDHLRTFWKINKAELARVQRFSQPKYEQLEAIFKKRAGELSK